MHMEVESVEQEGVCVSPSVVKSEVVTEREVLAKINTPARV